MSNETSIEGQSVVVVVFDTVAEVFTSKAKAEAAVKEWMIDTLVEENMKNLVELVERVGIYKIFDQFCDATGLWFSIETVDIQ